MFWKSGQKLNNFENGNWATEFWKAKLITCVGCEKRAAWKKSDIARSAIFFLNFKEANLWKLISKKWKMDNWNGKVGVKISGNGKLD